MDREAHYALMLWFFPLLQLEHPWKKKTVFTCLFNGEKASLGEVPSDLIDSKEIH